ncbi:MAG: hypothetical protein DBX97_02860 [Collinsella tanakaei]|nr:MAG: hypothetical protein DBX97_02860 [Collinsella tanakaei]
MSFLLTKELPETVLIDGRNVKINTDFRVSIEFELLMLDDLITDEEKLVRTLQLYYEKIPENIVEALEKCIWFYSCGKANKKRKASKTLYRFDTDADYIYAAFLSQYKIDLLELPYMHWWKFRSMFQGLGEENEFAKIIGYRAIDISSKMTSEQKRFYKRMKEQYKIPMSEKKSKLVNNVEEALLHGGDLSQIL